MADECFKAEKQTTLSALHSTSPTAESSRKSSTSSSSKNPSLSTTSNKLKQNFRNKRSSGKNVVHQWAPEIQIEPKKKPTGNCFHCGKPGHWTRNCPQLKGKIQQIRSLLQHIDNEEAARHPPAVPKQAEHITFTKTDHLIISPTPPLRNITIYGSNHSPLVHSSF
jgi:hypothetical protein